MAESAQLKSRRAQIALLATLLVAVGATAGLGMVNSAGREPDVRAAARDAGCAIEEEFENQGQRHLEGSEAFDDFNSSPATSGPHAQQPAAWGPYGVETVPERVLVHNLEHGGVVIHTKGLDGAQLSQVDGLADSYRDGVVSHVNPDIDSPVVITAWTRKVECRQFDASVVDSFIQQWCGRGPEKIASCMKR